MIKVAIIGAGEVAKLHAASLSEIRGVHLHCCCDLQLAKAANLAWEFGFDSCYSSVSEMVANEDMDAVVVCVPTHFHYEVCREVLTRPIHILCEKPMTGSAKQAQSLASLARKREIVNMVGFETRGMAELVKAKALVRSGRLGKVMHVDASYLQSWMGFAAIADMRSESLLWRLTGEFGGRGVVDDLGLSLLDAIQSLAGRLREVSVQARSFRKTRANQIKGMALDASDSAVITASFNNGAIGAFHLSRWATGEENSLRIRIYGDKGGLKLDVDENSSLLQVCTGENRQRSEWSEVYCKPVPNIWQNFINAIRKGKYDAQPNFAYAGKLHKLIEGE